ncbi:hypothetical protein QIU19_02555 [Capnocytophaga canimorsus]|nr:hypothetical protein [Capnocytophaga canimorsus]WGU68843.1 hypothetical protein QIU19_02555 [Capnocytophaga canimorsus]
MAGLGDSVRQNGLGAVCRTPVFGRYRFGNWRSVGLAEPKRKNAPPRGRNLALSAAPLQEIL